MDRRLVLGPHQVSFDITNKCNLRCLHCYNNSGENIQSTNELTDDEVLRFIDEFKDIRLLNFCFCGGETLLRKDLIIRCCQKLKEYECFNLSMVTNGLLLTDGVAQDLIEAGINKIQVSLDGIKPESHDHIRNQKGAYEGAIKAIKLLSKMKVNVGVAFTPTTYNIEEIIGIRNFLLDLGISGANLRVQPLMIMGRATKNSKDILPTTQQYRRLVKIIRDLNMEKSGLLIEWGDPVDHLIRFKEKDFLTNNCTVRSNGEIIVDPYLPIVLGNLRNHTFVEYWNSGFRDIWRSDLIKKLSGCILSIKDMDLENNNYLPEKFRHGDIYIDIIDDDFRTREVELIGEFAG